MQKANSTWTEKVKDCDPEIDLQRVLLVMGDKQLGKTSFLDNLDSKGSMSKVKSFGLQYSYSEMVYLNQNITVNYYELNGGLASTHLMQYPLNVVSVLDATVFLMVDGSSLETVYNGLEQWLPEVYQQV
jgi:septin family protein